MLTRLARSTREQDHADPLSTAHVQAAVAQAARLATLRGNPGPGRQDVVDAAIRVGGGASYFRGSELERLYRDVLAGGFHPSSRESAQNTVADAWLGPVPDENGPSTEPGS